MACHSGVALCCILILLGVLSPVLAQLGKICGDQPTKIYLTRGEKRTIHFSSSDDAEQNKAVSKQNGHEFTSLDKKEVVSSHSSVTVDDKKEPLTDRFPHESNNKIDIGDEYGLTSRNRPSKIQQIGGYQGLSVSDNAIHVGETERLFESSGASLVHDDIEFPLNHKQVDYAGNFDKPVYGWDGSGEEPSLNSRYIYTVGEDVHNSGDEIDVISWIGDTQDAQYRNDGSEHIEITSGHQQLELLPDDMSDFTGIEESENTMTNARESRDFERQLSEDGLMLLEDNGIDRQLIPFAIRNTRQIFGPFRLKRSAAADSVLSLPLEHRSFVNSLSEQSTDTGVEHDLINEAIRQRIEEAGADGSFSGDSPNEDLHLKLSDSVENSGDNNLRQTIEASGGENFFDIEARVADTDASGYHPDEYDLLRSGGEGSGVHLTDDITHARSNNVDVTNVPEEHQNVGSAEDTSYWFSGDSAPENYNEFSQSESSGEYSARSSIDGSGILYYEADEKDSLEQRTLGHDTVAEFVEDSELQSDYASSGEYSFDADETSGELELSADVFRDASGSWESPAASKKEEASVKQPSPASRETVKSQTDVEWSSRQSTADHSAAPSAVEMRRINAPLDHPLFLEQADRHSQQLVDSIYRLLQLQSRGNAVRPAGWPTWPVWSPQWRDTRPLRTALWTPPQLAAQPHSEGVAWRTPGDNSQAPSMLSQSHGSQQQMGTRAKRKVEEPQDVNRLNWQDLKQPMIRYMSSLPKEQLIALTSPDHHRHGSRSTRDLSPPFTCQWSFETSPELYMLVRIHNVSTPLTVDCSGAYIEIQQRGVGADFETRWCGDAAPKKEDKPRTVFARQHVHITAHQTDMTGSRDNQVTQFSASVEVVDLKETNHSELAIKSGLTFRRLVKHRQ